MFGSESASVIPAYAWGKMKSLSPETNDAISVSLSAFGTMTTLATLGLSSPQYASFLARTSWSRLHDSILSGRAENGMLSAMSAETSLQFWKAEALRMPANRFLYGA